MSLALAAFESALFIKEDEPAGQTSGREFFKPPPPFCLFALFFLQRPIMTLWHRALLFYLDEESVGTDSVRQRCCCLGNHRDFGRDQSKS